MNRTEEEGRSVWDNCPFAEGLEIYLHVLDLPRMAVRIGQFKARQPKSNVVTGPSPLDLPGPSKFVNGPLVKTGPWPGDDWPITKGCNLAVIPAWELSAPVTLSVDRPRPTATSNEGVDCRTLDEVSVFVASLSAVFADAIRVFVWVRHPTGLWTQPEGSTAPASGPSTRILVNTKAADRIYAQVVYTTPITAPYSIAYGRLTSPAQQFAGVPSAIELEPLQVRFGAVEAPKVFQQEGFKLDPFAMTKPPEIGA